MTDTKKPAPLTLTDLDELERLERDGTAGPWRQGMPACDCADTIANGESSVMLPSGECIVLHASDADAALVKESRNRLPQLLALARVGVLAVAENEAQKAVPRGPVVEGMDLTTTQAWMLASAKLDDAIVDLKGGLPK